MAKQAIVIHFQPKENNLLVGQGKDINQHKLANTDFHTRFTARHIMDDLMHLAKQRMAKLFKML